MNSIIFDQNRVDESIDLLSGIGNDISNLSNDLNEAANQILNARGFKEYVGGFSRTDLEEYITLTDDVTNTIIANIASKEITILEYNGDNAGAISVLESLSPSVQSILGINEEVISEDSLDEASDNIFVRTGATIGTFGVSLLEGGGQVIEAGADLLNMGFAGAKSLFKMAGNIFAGKDVTDGVSKIWEDTAASVSEKKCESIFNNFYENTFVGQALKNNAYAFDTTRSLGNGVGYATGVICLSALTGGVGATSLAATAGTLGIARGSEKAWSEGASIGEGLLYGAASGAWEGAQWFMGAKINQFVVGSSGPIASGIFKGANSGVGTRIALDSVTAASEGFVQPALSMIYKDYDGKNIFESYSKAFEGNGGWGGVALQGAIGALTSAGGEFVSARQALKGGVKNATDASDSRTKTGDSKSQYGDQSKIRRGYNADGDLQAERIFNDGRRQVEVNHRNGRYEGQLFDKRGRLIERLTREVDGTTRHDVMGADGTWTRKTSLPDGTVRRTRFNRTNQRVEQYHEFADGTRVHDIFHSDGTISREMTKNGQHSKMTLDRSGKIISRDGSVQAQAQRIFRSYDDVIHSAADPLSDENLGVIARRMNEARARGEKPYSALVSANSSKRKGVPTARTREAFYSKFNTRDYRIHEQGEYFYHVKSRNFSSSDGITDRLYLNMGSFDDAYRFAEQFADACQQKGLPFYFKTARAKSGASGKEILDYQLLRDESIVIYSDKKYLSDYTNIANEILKKNGFQLEKPPICAGVLSNNIGYGAEPVLPNESFNSIRAKVLDMSLRELDSKYSYIPRYSSEYIAKLKEIITQRGRAFGIDPSNFCLNG